MNKKCAPSKKFKDGSCFTHNALKKIAENYNKRSKQKINTNQSKEYIVKELENKLKDKCNNQVCWLKLDIVKEIDNEDILVNTFRPIGPSKKYDWLSTSHINDVIEQYQEAHKDFLFLGAVPHDFQELEVLGFNNLDFNDMEKDGKTKIGMVINLDNHNQSGSHWVALFADLKKNQIYFFDSVGKKPSKRIRNFIKIIAKYLHKKNYNSELPIDEVVDELKKINNYSDHESKQAIKNSYYKKYIKNLSRFDIRYNSNQHQFDNSECGVYSINFITRLVEGENFDFIINNITKDNEMNQNRKEYFINVN
jgi:hypothetical protein